MRHARPTARLAALAVVAGSLSVVGVAVAPAAAADPVDLVDAIAGGHTASPPDSLFPNQGNSGYDALHYDIAFSADFTPSRTANAVGTSTIDATTTIDARTTGAPLSSFSFDFQGSTGDLAASTLDVTAVTVDGVPAAFERIENTTTRVVATDKHKLVVTPVTPVDGEFTTVVEYSGSPVVHTDADDSSEGWNNTSDGATFLNQPVGSMTLFPNNNTPRDTATYTFRIDIPSKLSTSNYAQAGGRPYPSAAVSNGELVSRTPNDDGTRTTWVWDQRKPMASELSMVSIGRYDMYTSDITLASGRTIPEWTFIDPAISVANQTTTLSSRAQMKAVLDYLETKYGPYPGNSTGLVTDVVPSSINYALETQDRSFFPTSAGRATMYHELMHQWWGNQVTPTDWNDLWVSEGSASYSEAQIAFELAASTSNSPETALHSAWNSSNGNGSTWTTPTAAMTQASSLFGQQVYARGSWTLEALRTAIGAAHFETLMRTYQTRFAGEQTTTRRTAMFIALAEEISGRDLTAFFQPWLFGTTKAPWPVKFNLDLAGPATQVDPGDAIGYTLSVRNTGRVAMPAAGTRIAFDAAGILDDATPGTLPAGVTLTDTTFTWTVPATALGATASTTIPLTLNAATDEHQLLGTARAETLGGTCLVCTTTLAIGSPPVTPSPAPTITGGTPTVGVPLTAATAGWPDGTAFTYQWLIGGTPVPGANGATFTPTGDVVGLPVTVRVTGSLAGRNPVTVTSAATANGVKATPASSTPTITGTPQVGERLTVDPGAWEPGTIFSYQWQANGANISGATGPVYTPAAASQVGQTLGVVVTGVKYGYNSTPRTSASTAAVAAGDPLVATPTPTFSGVPKVGTVVVPTYGEWDPGVTLTFQWAANGTNVSGQAGTGGTFTPTAAHLGQVLTLTVTGTKPGVTPVTRTTAASSPVDLGTQVLQPTPTFPAGPRVGVASTGAPGTWDASTTRTYRWLVDDVAVGGATTTSFTPTVDQIGKQLTFEVTSTRAGYEPVTKASAPARILGYAQTLTPTPTITGAPKVDVPLTAEPGTWDDGVTLAYQWYAGEDPIDDATAATYTPGPARAGDVLRVEVTGTKPDFEPEKRTSDPTEAVALGDLTTTPVPTITGTPKVDVTLTAVPGAWDDGVTLSYQWYADGELVDGATSSSYTPGAARLGEPVTVEVTGTKTGYTPVTRASDPTGEVGLGDLTRTPVPTITGSPRVDVTLTAVPGAWDDDVTLSYQWYADGELVDGATSSTYAPSADRAGDAVTVAVTGTRTGYSPVTRTSAATAPVAVGDLVAPLPSIVGSPKVGAALTVATGAWSPGAGVTYQWFADGAPVPGATDQTFTPGPAEAGTLVMVAVTGSKAGYATVTRTSLPTAAVLPGDLSATPSPTISGTPRVGVALTAVPGTWDGGVTLTYEWRVGGTVSGTTASSYTPAPADVGKAISVAVTGTKAGYAPATRISTATSPVVPGDLAATPVPMLVGSPRVGAPLSADAGTWDAGTTLGYQWLRDAAPIAGATGSTYVPVVDDLNRALSVAVTGSKAGYASVTRTSTAATVATGKQTLTPKPTLRGKAQVGRTVRVAPADYDPGVQLSYRWFSAGQEVGTGSSVTITAQMRGRRVWVRVTASAPGYADVVRTSAKSAKIRR